MVLTDKQKHELHLAIFDYLNSECHGGAFDSTVAAFQQDCGVAPDVLATASGKGLLEKKWTSVIRLQKKVMDLEAKIATKCESRSGGDDSAAVDVTGSQDILSRRLPKGPARAVLLGHRGPITSVAVHPVYSLVASASEDCTVKLWDFDTSQYERTLKGHTGSVTCVVFNPSGSVLASSSADMTAKLWDMSSFQCTKTLRGHDHTLSCVVFAPSGDQVFTCARDQMIKCWEVATGFSLKSFSGHSDWVKGLAISADGATLASASSDHSVMVWRVDSGLPLQTLRGHEHVVETVALCDAVQLLLDPSTAAVNAKVEKYDVLYCASGSRDGSVRLWDALKGVQLLVFSAHENWVRGVLFHKSGKFIISCSDDKSVRVHDIKEGRTCRTIANAHEHFVSSLALSSNGQVLVTGSVDKKLCVWNCS